MVMAVDEAIANALLEQRLSEKLMEGYVIMEDVCPKCPLVPLVKNNQKVPKTFESHDLMRKNIMDLAVVVESQSFEQPFKPVNGVPVCVSCNAHVITCEEEIVFLEESGTLKNSGSIIVAINEMSTENNTKTPNAGVIVHGRQPEIINLENITEDDIVGNHRRHSPFMVDIETTPYDTDGASNVEMVVSPRMGDPRKPIDVEDIQENEYVDGLEHSIRREIATKVLGAKMLQGWTLKDSICNSCSMPMMEKNGKEDCHVCPALEKKKKKMIKKQKKTEAENVRVTVEAKAREEIETQTEEFSHIQSVREEIDAKALREDEEAIHRASDRKQAIEKEKIRLLAKQMLQDGMDSKPDTKPKPETNVEEEISPEIRERVRMLIEEERIELQRLESIAAEEEKRRELMAQAREKEEKLKAKEAKLKAKQEEEAKALSKEAEEIEALEVSTIAAADDKTVAMQKDLKVQEHLERKAKKQTIDEEVARLENDRIVEAMEIRRFADERRIETENRMIAALEADAAVKALAAEDAIRRAKEALREISDTKKHLLSQTIELAEREALIETEDTLKARFEDHNEPVILMTDSEINDERWDTLRLEGRAIMTRRVLQGWTIISEACVAEQCHNSPLVEKNGAKECVVCGGCGDGKGGVFAVDTPEANAATPTPPPPSIAESDDSLLGKNWLGNGQEDEFEKKREIYSKEIGKKMLQGWNIIDSSCSQCVMPLMMDDKGNTNICIICGPMNTKQNDTSTIATKQFDDSTIATPDMATLDITDGEEEHGALSPVVEVDSVIETIPSEESDLASSIQRHAFKQRAKRNLTEPKDPPAFKPVAQQNIMTEQVARMDVITLPQRVDFADAAAIRELVGGEDDEEGQSYDDDTALSAEESVTTVANLFLKSPHGYDFQDFGQSMNVEEVKELVEIFLVTNVDRDVSHGFKLAVAQHILSRIKGEMISTGFSPLHIESNVGSSNVSFQFKDNDYKATKTATNRKQRIRPFPEGGGSDSITRRPPKSPRSRLPSPIHATKSNLSSRSYDDDASVASRASTVATEALESIYDRIDQCKKKLMDPNNSLDEQIATAALLEKLAEAAVAVREMEYVLR